MEATHNRLFDTADLEQKVKSMYRDVALHFLSQSANGASQQFGVKSISLLALKKINS